MCPRSWAAATPVKYKRDIQQLTYVLAIVKNSENNGTEEISLVTPTPGWGLEVCDELKVWSIVSNICYSRSLRKCTLFWTTFYIDNPP